MPADSRLRHRGPRGPMSHARGGWLLVSFLVGFRLDLPVIVPDGCS